MTPAALTSPAGTWPAAVAPGALMRAVVFREFGAPEVLHAEAVPVPVPAAGEVLVQVAAVSVGRLLDLAARSGTHPYRGYTFPHILGAEHAGVVAATGPSVTGWRPGDRVACFPVITDGSCGFCLAGQAELCSSLQLIGTHRPGAYAQYVAVPAGNLHRVPDGISPVQATGLALAGPVAMNQLRRAGFRPGQWVLVQGASSGLGSVTASLARHLGGHVIAASRGAAKRERLTALGADAILDPADPGFLACLRELTGGRGADIVIDNLGQPDLWALSLASLAPGGALVSSGAFLGRQVLVDLQRLYLLGQRIIGVRTGNPASVSALWAEAERGLRPVPDTTFPLTDAVRAHRYLADGQNVGRVALLVAHEDPEGRDQPCASTAC